MCNTKVCNYCNKEKTLDKFLTKGLKCKDCTAEYAREYRKNNKERLAIIEKSYRERNPDKTKEIRKSYRHKNKDKYAMYSRGWYSNNKELVLEINRKWRAKNIEKVKFLNKNWRDNNKETLSACAYLALRGFKNPAKQGDLFRLSLTLTRFRKQLKSNSDV